MNKSLLFFLTLCSIVVYGDDETPVSHAVIEEQLTEAEAEFQEAQKMFNPWYAGPLLTPGAHIIEPGLFNIQPYLFYIHNYAKYNKHGKSEDIPSLNTWNPQFILLFGILPWMDGIVAAQGVWNKQLGHTAGNWGDTSFSLNFGLLNEGPYCPALLIGVKESFPTGKYEHLSSHKNGVDATGAGSYETNFSFNMSKIVWWVATHPMNFRFSLEYTIPSLVKVHGFNTYGGGFGTSGKVRPGGTFAGEFGYEYSFTQKWVAALDVLYTYMSKTTFSGHTEVPVGGPFNEQLSLAPAIEYNPNPDLGVIVGVWFTVWGRNAYDFVSGVASVTYTF